jgi:hypothetical protein
MNPSTENGWIIQENIPTKNTDITQQPPVKKPFILDNETFIMKCHINIPDADTYFANNINNILQKKVEKINALSSAEIETMYKMNRALHHYNSAVIINIEPNNAIPIVIPQKHIQKMPTCGTWFDECCNCCFIPAQYVARCCFNSSRCGQTITMKISQFYFFILYLFTGELNSEAMGYKNYFNMTSKKDDQVNVPEILITATSIVFELYKTLIGSFLTVFTAQRCGQQTCTIWENIVPKNDMELAGIIFNFLMATTLLIEYIFEIMREAYLIKYLKYDKSLANNGEHIAELYETANKNIFTKLIPLYIIYIRFSYVVLLIYFVNVILSATIVARNYYDNTSIFSFVTNALFIIYKIYNVVEITSYRGDYFYSAYKKKNIHYNDIKPKYLLKPIIEINDDEASSPNSAEDSYKDVENGVIVLENQVAPENIVLSEDESKVVYIDDPTETLTMEDVFTSFCKNTKEIVPKKPKLPVIDDGEDLNDTDKAEVLKELYEKKYIDKKVYYKISLFLRKSEYGGVEISEA